MKERPPHPHGYATENKVHGVTPATTDGTIPDYKIENNKIEAAESLIFLD